jgi:hypothetical protein
LYRRDSYGNFLARLETKYGVSQKGVQAIAEEMIQLSKSVLSHCMNSVTEHLGKWFFFVGQSFLANVTYVFDV